MEIIIKNQDSSESSIAIGKFNISYKKNEKFPFRDIIIETEKYLILGDSNISFKKRILNAKNIEKEIENNINHLNNGYLLFIDKQSLIINIYTDIFGFFHLFYLKKQNNFILSSRYNEILKHSDKEIDKFSVLDLLLFNYTLLDRTLYKQIKRVRGGTKITLVNDDIVFDTKYNFADNFYFQENTTEFSYKEFSNIFLNSVKNELVEDLPVFISATGGLDSRTLIATCSNVGIDYKTITFGQKGNIENKTIEKFIHNYSSEHVFVELDESYTGNISKIFQKFIECNIDNPVFHSLVEYESCLPFVQSSNYLVGFMGGELINGQSIGAQVMLTEVGAKLLTLKNTNDLTKYLIDKVKFTLVFNEVLTNDIIHEYISSIKIYKYRKDKLNVLQFMLNEVYSKLFGAVNKITYGNLNFIAPFVGYELIFELLNSKYSFFKKKSFKQNPFVNIKNKIFYGKVINHLNPSLSDTNLDRLYKVKHITSYKYFFKIVFAYFLNHYLSKNKKDYVPTTRYDRWYKDIIKETITDDEINLIDNFFHIDKNKSYENYNKVDLKMTAILKALEIGNKI